MARGVPDEVLNRLRAVPLFSGCTRKELATIAGLGTRLTVPEGTDVTTQGAHGAELVIVLSGTAACTVDGTQVATFGPGEFFGEMSLLDHGPRSATVSAQTALEVIVLDGREFRGLISTAPEIAWKMLGTMAARLRVADASLHH